MVFERLNLDAHVEVVTCSFWGRAKISGYKTGKIKIQMGQNRNVFYNYWHILVGDRANTYHPEMPGWRVLGCPCWGGYLRREPQIHVWKGSRSNRPQSNRLPIKSLYYYVFLFILIICIVNCVVYLIPNQIIVLLCCLFNLIICS